MSARGGFVFDFFFQMKIATKISKRFRSHGHLAEMVFPDVSPRRTAHVRFALDGGEGSVRKCAHEFLLGDEEGNLFSGLPEGLCEFGRKDQRVVAAANGYPRNGIFGCNPGTSAVLRVPGPELEAVGFGVRDEELE